MDIRVNRVKVIAKPMNNPILCFETDISNDTASFKELEGKSLTGYVLSLKKPKKSLNANAYMWVLADKIASKIRATKEDVYIKAVREVGAWIDITVKTDEIAEVTTAWKSHGIGWFSETMLEGNVYSDIRLYQGSSVYTQEQMARLVDYIVDEAKNLGIETMTPQELERLKAIWE